MAKIIHTGDIHLDSAFTSLSSEEAQSRRKGLRSLFSNLIDIANSEKADAVIIAGDLFDAYPIYAETEEALICDLSRAEMPVFISPGNHDPYSPESPYKSLSFPGNVHIFPAGKLSSVELPDSNLRIFGTAYESNVFDERILEGFKVPCDDYINIISLHANLYTDDCCPVSAEEIGNTGADYVALAHVHKPTEILKSKNTHYAYCGCLESRDFGELYESGFYIIELSKDNFSANRRNLSDIRYREITVDISENPDIISALPSPWAREHLRLTVTGDAKEFDADKLFAELSKTYEEVIITDKTTAPRDIWQGIEEDTLRGAFLRRLKAQLSECSDEREKQKILLAVKYGIAAIENRDM